MLILILPSLFIPSFAAGMTKQANDDFIEELLLCSDLTLPYKVNDNVYETIKANTGCDDLYKTYMVTGKPTSSYTSNRQYFENGKYEKGKWIPDNLAASLYIQRAIDVYDSLKLTLTNDRQSAAKSIISYGFESLPLMERISIQNAPKWLVGDCFDGQKIIYNLDDSYVTPKPSANGFAARIRNDREACSFGVLADVKNQSSYLISIPDDAEYFVAYLSCDLASGSDFSDAKMRVCLLDGNGNESEYGIYCIYRGFENRVEIRLDGAQKLRLEFSFSSPSGKLKVILADASFTASSGKTPDISEKSSIARLGDCNLDGIVNELDIAALTETLLFTRSSGDCVCDIDKNGEVDYLDCLCLENYLIFIRNMNHEYNDQSKKLSVAVLGDSIARGYGLDDAENGRASSLAYGSLVASELDRSTMYDIDFVNRGFDGDKVSDLMNKLKQASSPERRAAKSADLIMLSIGGNDFLASLKEVFGTYFDIDTENPENALSQMSKIKYTEIIKFLASDVIDSAVDNAAREYQKEAQDLISYISLLNPDALILLTTIPNTAQSSDFVYRLTVPLLGQHDILLGNLYEFADEWLCYFNEIISNELSNFSKQLIIVDEGDVFDGSAELSLMEISNKVYLNDIASGNFESVKHFDIHPSAAGHSKMASEHIKALDGQIKKWNAEYTGNDVKKEEYKYSKSGKENLTRITTAAENAKENEILYTVGVDNANKLSNLLLTVNFNDELLTLDDVEIKGASGILSNESNGVFRLLAKDGASLSDKITLTLTFKNVSEKQAKAVISALAKESLLTADRKWSAECTSEAEITLSSKQDDNKPQSGTTQKDTDTKDPDDGTTQKDTDTKDPDDGTTQKDTDTKNPEGDAVTSLTDNNDDNSKPVPSDGEDSGTSLSVSGDKGVDPKIIIYVVFTAAILAVIISLVIAAAAAHNKKKEEMKK